MQHAATALVFAALVCCAVPAAGQQGAPPADATVERRDPELDAAAALIGRALFLRCFCMGERLGFDAGGKPQAEAAATDWTLAAVDVQKVERRSGAEIEFDGVPVAVGYNAQAHEWQRHPQKEDKVRLVLTGGDDPAVFRRALNAVFAIGIDRALQQRMPPYWTHYFDPKLGWDDDAVAGPVYLPGPAGLVSGQQAASAGRAAGPAVSEPEVTHKAGAPYTAAAQHERVSGRVQVRFVVDADGVPHQIAIVQPLGYGLDARAAEAVSRMRFAPALREGRPVAASVMLNQQFEVVAVPR